MQLDGGIGGPPRSGWMICASAQGFSHLKHPRVAERRLTRSRIRLEVVGGCVKAIEDLFRPGGAWHPLVVSSGRRSFLACPGLACFRPLA
jgi:hypothetical protein